MRNILYSKEAGQAAGSRDLDTFNGLVLRHQDEAYTLAYHLLGLEDLATRVVQAAFVKAYREGRWSSHRFRLQILDLVSSACLKQRERLLAQAPGENSLAWRLAKLPDAPRLAMVLVDVLGLSYDEAAAVSHRSRGSVGKLLAQARRRLYAEHPSG